MSHKNMLQSLPKDPVAKLAEYFPKVVPVDMPVRLVLEGAPGAGETTTIEYGSASEALFSSTLPLEYSDVVCLKSPYGSMQAEAQVVAVQQEGGRRAVAVRLLESERKRMS